MSELETFLSASLIPHRHQLPADTKFSKSESEEFIDKFASLFSPATPPATPRSSPRLIPTLAPIHPIPHTHHPEIIGSPDSDFGSFVSVAPSQDPLSLLSGFSPPASPVLSTSNRQRTGSHAKNGGYNNASLKFFDKFTTDAKRASELNKKDYLEELLLHEDDPLYWLKDEPPSFSDPSVENHDHGIEGVDATEGRVEAVTNSGPLQDTVNENFACNNRTESPTDEGTDVRDTERSDHQPTTHFNTSPEHTSSPSPERRIPDTPSRPSSALAMSTSSIDSDRSQSHLPFSKTSASLQNSPRSNHNTLSTFSSRWMTSLLSSSRPSEASTSPNTHQTLNTLFAAHPPAAPDLKAASMPHHPSPRSTPTDSGTPTRGGGMTIQRTPHPRFTASSASSVAISHGTPFGSHISSFIPPSGAPGFTGGDHSWDRGFSVDFDKQEQGKVLLKERREGDGYVAVLDDPLASLIRPHLPALSRLSDTWTLLYSLDQHGISLNTLYKRCENQRIKTSISGMGDGALVVIKDSGDTVFGVWLGEGLRMSKGSYYGSGESFLWRSVNGRLEVFKWTGRNDYVALCETGFISFGGGDGHYGLYLDDSLIDGSSAHCLTFDNEPLCSPGPKKGEAVTFECVGLEVWRIG